MTEADAKEAIKQHWESGWEALHPVAPDPDCIPYTFTNESFTAVAAWARLTIVTTTSEQATMGASPKVERRGVIMVQLFSTIDGGSQALDLLVEDVRNVFELESIVYAGGAVNCYAATCVPIDENGAWHACAVSIPYRIMDQR